MRTLSLLPFLIVGMVACSDGRSRESADSTAQGVMDSTSNTGHDHHAVDSAQAIQALPAIPDSAKVFFVNLKDGQKIKSPFKVQMGVSGIALDTAGVIKQASGHHHIIIDGDSLTAGTVVPKDSTHLHFGNAQKEAELNLTPGQHKLTLQYADGIHRSYGGKLATSVNVTVQK